MIPTTNPVITDSARISAHVLRTPGHVRRVGRYDTIPRDGNVSGTIKGPVLIRGTKVSPTCGIMGIQEIVSIHGSTSSVEIGDTQKFKTSIDGNLAENGDSTPISRKVIGQKLSHDSISNIYLRCRVDFRSNTVGTEAPYFMNLGLPAVNAPDELRYFGTPATRVGRPTDGSNWSAPVRVCV